MTKLYTSLRTTYENAKIFRYFSNIVPETNVQDAIDSLATAAFNPTKPANLTPITVTNAMSPYPVGANDYLIYVDVTAGPVELDLPDQATRGNLPVIIKHVAGDATVNNFTIDPFAGQTIDTFDPYVIDYNQGGVTLQPRTGGYTVLP